MRSNWDCTARQVLLQYTSDPESLPGLLEHHDALFWDIDGAYKFLFLDNSILIIDESGEATFMNIQIEQPTQSQQTNSTQNNTKGVFARIKNKKLAVLGIIGGVLVSGAAIASVVHFHKS